MNQKQTKAAVEAMLFAAGDPVSADKLAAAVQQVVLPVVAHDLVDLADEDLVDCLRLPVGYLQLHTAHCVDHRRTRRKGDHHIVVDMYVKVLLDGVHQQFRAAVGIRRIQLGAALPRNVHIGITHKRSHVDLMRFGIQRH